MLKVETLTPFSERDAKVFATVVPADHYLRRVAGVIDFERFRPMLADAYSATMGRPPVDPICMLKILYLRFHYRLASDRLVMARTQTDMAFRWFLGLPLDEPVPNHTNGTHFRHRIGAERFNDVFQGIVTQAREHGLVRDRLRLKDATHMYANAADLQPLQLAAQVRERLLRFATPFFPDWVSAQQIQIETLRQTTAEFPDDERLAARVEHLSQMVAELRERIGQLPPATESDRARQRLLKIVEVADKLLADRADPQAKDRLVNGAEPAARIGKHGLFFLGFLLDLLMDADSEIITAVNVLPANGAEAADAITLIEQEEAAQGNDVEGMSIDGAGYNGPVLRELTDPDGLNLDVTVPPPKPSERKTFGPERFTLTVLENGVAELTCPNEQRTRQRERIEKDTGWKYVFKPSQCAGCPRRTECLQNPKSKGGRTVIKNDYEAEYAKVEAKARTPEYAATRREHPKIERKLGEMVRHHGARRACFRGTFKVLVQALLTAMAVNVKRMVKLVAQKTSAVACELAVRAELSAV